MKKRLIIIGIVIVLGLAIYGLIGNDNSPLKKLTSPSPAPTIADLNTNYIPQQRVIENAQKDYEIVFDPNSNLYIISILGKPFDKIRLQAEQDLIKKLSISKNDACKIKVNIGSPYYANPDQTEIFHTFSFCSN